ncbi:MAG: hypothetical protein AAFX94_26230, partial [Myxococcota bacterium]
MEVTVLAERGGLPPSRTSEMNWLANGTSAATPARMGDSTVSLPKGSSASSFLLQLLIDAKARFPRTFKTVELPETSETFKKSFASTLVEVEQKGRSAAAL